MSAPAYLHKPTGNVFKAADHEALLPIWQKFAPLMSAEEIAATFVPLDDVSTLQLRVKQLEEALRQALTHVEDDECSHGRTFAAGRVARATLGIAEEDEDGVA